MGGVAGTCGDGMGGIKGSSDDGGTCGDDMGGIKGSSDDCGGMDGACGVVMVAERTIVCSGET